MSSSRRRPELRLSISQGRDGSQYHRGGTPEKSPSSGKYFLLTSPFIEQIIFRTRGAKAHARWLWQRSGTGRGKTDRGRFTYAILTSWFRSKNSLLDWLRSRSNNS